MVEPSSRNAFGLLLVPPEQLPLPERVDCARRAVGELLASTSPELRWLGRGLQRWLSGDADDLAMALGLRAAPGSRLTPQAIVMREHQHAVLRQLAVALGSNTAAERVLRGLAACPPEHAALVAAVRELHCPASRRSLTRARSAPRATRGRGAA